MADRHKPRNGYQSAYQAANREAARRWKVEHGEDEWRELVAEFVNRGGDNETTPRP
jgi:hypothetical protein